MDIKGSCQNFDVHYLEKHVHFTAGLFGGTAAITTQAEQQRRWGMNEGW